MCILYLLGHRFVRYWKNGYQSPCWFSPCWFSPCYISLNIFFNLFISKSICHFRQMFSFPSMRPLKSGSNAKNICHFPKAGLWHQAFWNSYQMPFWLRCVQMQQYHAITTLQQSGTLLFQSSRQNWFAPRLTRPTRLFTCLRRCTGPSRRSTGRSSTRCSTPGSRTSTSSANRSVIWPRHRSNSFTKTRSRSTRWENKTFDPIKHQFLEK